MSMANELTLVRILTILAEKYPRGIKDGEIVSVVGLDRRDDVEKHLSCSTEKRYALMESGLGFNEGLDFELESYRLTAEGIDYLDDYRKKLAEVLKEIKRKPMGFQANNE